MHPAISTAISLTIIASAGLALLAIASTLRAYLPHFRELRRALHRPLAPDVVHVTCLAQPVHVPVSQSTGSRVADAFATPLRDFARKLGRHHAPKPITHRLHRFDKVARVA